VREYINNIEISEYAGHWGKSLVYVDNKLASDGVNLRPKKGYKYWIRFIKSHPNFNSNCLVSDHFRDGKSFEEKYKQ